MLIALNALLAIAIAFTAIAVFVVLMIARVVRYEMQGGECGDDDPWEPASATDAQVPRSREIATGGQRSLPRREPELETESRFGSFRLEISR